MSPEAECYGSLMGWIDLIDTKLEFGTADERFEAKVKAEAPPEAMAYLRLRFDDGEVGE